MKKILLTVTVLLLFLALTACSSSNHKHEYVIDSETAVTCTEAGSVTYKCSECGHIYTKTINAGHSWKTGSCTSPKTCERCGETEGEAPGHTYENNVCTRCKDVLALDLEIPTPSAEEPLIINNKKGEIIHSTYKITDIRCELSATSSTDITVTIILEGEKTFDKDYGKSRYSVGRIAYQIRDEEGYVIFSNTKDTMMLVEGDKFKNLKISLTGFNSEQKYTLTFMDYYS